MADAYEANLYSDEENTTKTKNGQKRTIKKQKGDDRDVNDSARVALNSNQEVMNNGGFSSKVVVF